MEPGESAPGWDAIEAAVAAHVPAQEPLHWGTDTLPGRGGIYGISAYRGAGHWLLVTFGLTELFAKESDDPGTSGWGFELTMRVPAADGPPGAWTLNLLRQLGRAVFVTGRVFAAGHRLDPGGPITGSADTRLTAIAFADDPVLGPIATPHGAARFLTVFGITAAELRTAQETSTAELLAPFRAGNPLLITDPAR
ncbi:suppressor of fused domain protein [Amycolatopsis sp. NPDC026612]|uniref:suppressor of fused domain protein n=1 Tax=Amycolatopsis sp. NPDC026612 TaxID=3155466 RepID=UPI0033FD516F